MLSFTDTELLMQMESAECPVWQAGRQVLGSVWWGGAMVVCGRWRVRWAEVDQGCRVVGSEDWASSLAGCVRWWVRTLVWQVLWVHVEGPRAVLVGQLQMGSGSSVQSLCAGPLGWMCGCLCASGPGCRCVEVWMCVGGWVCVCGCGFMYSCL